MLLERELVGLSILGARVLRTEDPGFLTRGGVYTDDEAAELAADGTEPGEDIHADRAFRQHLARVLTRRALEHRRGEGEEVALPRPGACDGRRALHYQPLILSSVLIDHPSWVRQRGRAACNDPGEAATSCRRIGIRQLLPGYVARFVPDQRRSD